MGRYWAPGAEARWNAGCGFVCGIHIHIHMTRCSAWETNADLVPGMGIRRCDWRWVTGWLVRGGGWEVKAGVEGHRQNCDGFDVSKSYVPCRLKENARARIIFWSGFLLGVVPGLCATSIGL